MGSQPSRPSSARAAEVAPAPELREATWRASASTPSSPTPRLDSAGRSRRRSMSGDHATLEQASQALRTQVLERGQRKWSIGAPGACLLRDFALKHRPELVRSAVDGALRIRAETELAARSHQDTLDSELQDQRDASRQLDQAVDATECLTMDEEPGPARRLIVLDWDDTLFPTTALESQLGLALEGKRFQTPELKAHAAKVIALLDTARALGDVALVTASRNPWVTTTCRCFLPGVEAALADLDVFYAPDWRILDQDASACCPRQYSDARWHPNAPTEKFVQQKFRAMVQAMHGREYSQVLCLGDGNLEMSAAWDLSFVCSARVQTVKMQEQPSLGALGAELDLLAADLEWMMQDSTPHFRLGVSGGRAVLQPPLEKEDPCTPRTASTVCE